QGNELLSAFKVANFCGAEDDGTFWSCWIQPNVVAQADPLVFARNKKNYMEDAQPENSSKRKTRGLILMKESVRPKADHPVNLTLMIEGAPAQVRGWSYGNLSKKDAALFPH
ncbi:hypothetical protein IFM89_019452, partial [Coptis chinensis]